jgi:hypothetical protein
LVFGTRFPDLPFAVVAVTKSDKGGMVILWNTVFLETSVSEVMLVKLREIRVSAKNSVNIFFSGDSFEVPEARITFADDCTGVSVLITEVAGET